MEDMILIKNDFNNTLIIEKSEFICYLKRCENEDECKTFISNIRKMHYDATHVCTAYYIDENLQKSNDDGEPKGTAGIPMLETIKKMHIKKICACVVRYFGGIKLGKGGLIRAYSSAVSEALKKCEKVKLVPYNVYTITFPYNMINKLEYFLNRKTTIIDKNFAIEVCFTFITNDENVENELIELTNNQCPVKFVANKLIETDIK